MQVLTHVDEVRALLDGARARSASVGVVPTMGSLHRGHASLVERAAAECDVVVVTVFVNPLQFGAGEDLEAYPRDLQGDVDLAAACGAGVVFAPDESEMYPAGREGVLTSVSVRLLTERFEGASRPTHFAGVCTVVAKLFNILGPARAYFGEKDFQQLAVVTQMVRDLSMPVEVIGCPTVREPDGLALSSRNVYLSPSHRSQATVISAALRDATTAYCAGTRSASDLEQVMVDRIASAPDGVLDYVAVVGARTLERVVTADDDSRLLVAVAFGSTRLLDNASVLGVTGAIRV
ncbi:MAG: pantoate--beta-alanine ligase [Actinobacteria bacterium]|nr:pantoate--beta-alanine ligase [Actinomycetota bacterium]